MKSFMFACAVVLFSLVAVRGDGNLHSYKTARMKVSVNDFGPFAKDLLGSVKGSLINHILSKKVDEQHHGVKVGKDGSEQVVLTLYLSENKDHIVIRANKKPLFTMKVERYAKGTKTVSTLFWKSQAGKGLNKLCFQMHAPLPDTPEKVWSRVIKLGAGADGFDAKCSSQDSSSKCKAYKVCEAKKKWFVRFDKCVPKSKWGSDKVFKSCAKKGAEKCYETRTGDAMKVLLTERVWLRARAGSGSLLKKSFNFLKKSLVQGVRREREKTLSGSNGGMSIKTTVHAPRDESFDYENVGKCVYADHKTKFYLLNKIPFGPPVDFMPCDLGGMSLIEEGEGNAIELSMSTEEKALLGRLSTLTKADLHTEKGMATMKDVGSLLMGIGIGLGAIALIGIFFIVKLVAFFIVPILFIGGLCLLASMI